MQTVKRRVGAATFKREHQNTRMMHGTTTPRDRRPTRQQRAFTLVELLVVLAAVGVLGLTLWPAMAGAKGDSRIISCLNNQRALARALLMYADDHAGRIARYQSAGGYWGGPVPGLNSTMTTAQAESAVRNGLQNNNLLFPYGPRVEINHCPADQRVNTQTLIQGWAYDSYSKTQNMTGEQFNNYWGAGTAYTSIFQVQTTDPSMTFAFMEDADERNWNMGAWTLYWHRTTSPQEPDWFDWVDAPAVRHGTMSTMALADGSAKARRWQDPRVIQAGRTIAGQSPGVINPGWPISSQASGADGQFVHDHYRFPGWK